MLRLLNWLRLHKTPCVNKYKKWDWEKSKEHYTRVCVRVCLYKFELVRTFKHPINKSRKHTLHRSANIFESKYQLVIIFRIALTLAFVQNLKSHVIEPQYILQFVLVPPCCFRSLYFLLPQQNQNKLNINFVISHLKLQIIPVTIYCQMDLSLRT